MSKATIQKPLGLIRKELQEKIINAVNESKLPLSMSAYIIKDILDGINATVAQQDSVEIAEYQAKIAESGKDE